MSNIHKELDDPNLHESKGFTAALNNGEQVKNERAASAWEQRQVLLPAISFAAANAAPPTENDGDIYILNAAGGNLDVNVIAWQLDNTIRYSFNGGPDLSGVSAGDCFKCTTATNGLNNGRFVVTAVNNGAHWLEVTNVYRGDNTLDEASDSPAVGQITDEDWDGCGQGEWARYNAADNKWYYIVPAKGMLCYINSSSTWFTFGSSSSSSGSSETNITAHSGGGQASAYQLTKKVSKCTTAGADHDSVKAPDAFVDNDFYFINASAYIVDLYPKSGQNFNGQAADAPLVMQPGTSCHGYCLTVKEFEQL